MIERTGRRRSCCRLSYSPSTNDTNSPLWTRPSRFGNSRTSCTVRSTNSHRTTSTTYEAKTKMSQTSSISAYESTPSDPSTTNREVEDKLYRYVDKINQQVILIESKMDKKFHDLNVSLFFLNLSNPKYNILTLIIPTGTHRVHEKTSEGWRR